MKGIRLGVLILSIFLLLQTPLFPVQNVSGFWKTINHNEGFVTSVIAVYEYNNKLYGQVIIGYDENTGILIDTIYDPRQHIAGENDNPFMCKSNLFWNLCRGDKKWSGGTIIDPRNGKVYFCQLWKEKDILVLRGKWGFFWRDQILHPIESGDSPDGFIFPDIKDFIPIIPILQ